jgi:integrase
MVERLKVGSKSYTKWDSKATGLGIKITRTGKRIWRLQLRYPGHAVQTKRTLGVYPAMKLAEAREKAAQWQMLVRQGTDPKAAEEEKQRTAAAARLAKAKQDAQTFAAVAEKFISEHLAGQRRGKAGAREVRNMLVAAWGERPIASITPADCKALIGQIKARAPYQARAAFGHLAVLFKFAIHHDLLDVSPIASLSKKMLFAGSGIAPRQRVLNDDEIRALWRATARLGFPYRQVYRLLLLTACRHREISHARWSELHPKIREALRKPTRPVDWNALPPTAKTLTIPAARFKSGSTHTRAAVERCLTSDRGSAEVPGRLHVQLGLRRARCPVRLREQSSA